MAADDILPKPIASIVTRLAYEGVPVNVIARSVATPSDDVRECLEEAVADGQIVEMPANDWPPTARRKDHLPVILSEQSDGDMLTSVMRALKLTRLQASFMLVLLKRNEADKATLHRVVESERAVRANRPDDLDETDPKMVDVVICNIRKRVRPLGVKIETIWGAGYYLEDESRKIIHDLIANVVTTQI